MDCNTIYVSNATTTDTGVVLIPNRDIRALTNGTCYGLVICCNATATANEPVFIQTVLGNIPVLCKMGNTMYANQLQKRVHYSVGYGNLNDNYTNGQFVVLDRVCPRSATTATTTTTEEPTTNPTTSSTNRKVKENE